MSMSGTKRIWGSTFEGDTETEGTHGGSALFGESPRTVLLGLNSTSSSRAAKATATLYTASCDEPCRCRRTDGKNWRCSKDAVPGHNFCDKHLAHMARSHAKRRRSAAIAATAKAVESGLLSRGKAAFQEIDPAVPLLMLLAHERDHEVPEAMDVHPADVQANALARAAAAEVPSAA
jgi:hypothetical protein